MNHKWQYFVIGILSGILISGIAVLVYIKLVNSEKTYDYQQAKAEVVFEVANDQPLANEALEVEYINIGKINLNQANINELNALPGIGNAKAKAIIDFRETYGDYQKIDELLYVPGIGDSLFQEIKDLIYVP